MHAGQLIFAQLLSFLPRHEFNKCVARYQGNRRARAFRCWEQFAVMAFAQVPGGLVLQIHKVLANLMWAYVIAHAGIALLHQAQGHDVLRRMIWRRARSQSSVRRSAK